MYDNSTVKIMKTMQKQLLLTLIGSLCIFSGCGSSPAANDLPDDAALSESETVSGQQDTEQLQEAEEELQDELLDMTEETESIFDEAPWEKMRWMEPVPVTELSPEEITFNYQSFLFLCGMSADEVQTATGRELTFQENFGDSMIYTDSDTTKYYFLTEQDALYCMEYETPDAETALSLAQSCYEEIYGLYGEDYVYQDVQWYIHEIESVDELNDNKFKESYGEKWPVLYSSRMEEKVKDYLITDKVRLSLYIQTPIYQNQGYYSVGISQSSGPLETE